MLAVKTDQRGKKMRRRKTGMGVLLILAIVCGLSGCGQSKTPEVSSVSIEKDGKIIHQIVGEFEQNYYEKDGLTSLAEERVAEYCADNGSRCVTLEDVSEEDGKVVIKFQYATEEDYSAFNNRELFVGTIEEAEEKGYNLGYVAFISVKGQPMEISDIEEPEKKQIAIIGMKPIEEMQVNTYGKVLYVNQSATSDLDVSISGKSGVSISYPALDSGAQESVLSYIIFE